MVCPFFKSTPMRSDNDKELIAELEGFIVGCSKHLSKKYKMKQEDILDMLSDWELYKISNLSPEAKREFSPPVK